jgi:hypothetical protein
MKRRGLLAAGGLSALGLSPFVPVQRAAAADASPLAAQVRRRLVEAPVLRGEFEQRRTLKGFRNPLLSRGDYLVARARGVVWRTREPFASTLVLTRERALSRQPDGRVDSQMDARELPMLRLVNRMLFALMAADLAVLDEGFIVDGQVGAAGWQLALAPRDASLTQWVSRIELAGEGHVEHVMLLEPQGDATTIRLSRQTAGQTLTADEEARFG